VANKALLETALDPGHKEISSYPYFNKNFEKQLPFGKKLYQKRGLKSMLVS
jgi:hypothetical protein